ncbi:MAG: hypothetical protein AAGU74_10075 [Bacillota bacterium]
MDVGTFADGRASFRESDRCLFEAQMRFACVVVHDGHSFSIGQSPAAGGNRETKSIITSKVGDKHHGKRDCSL